MKGDKLNGMRLVLTENERKYLFEMTQKKCQCQEEYELIIES